MPLIIKIGYNQYVFPDSALDAFKGGLFQVDEKTVKGKKKYVMTDEPADVEIKLATASQIVLPDTEEEQTVFKELYKEKDKLADNYMSKFWQAENENKTLKTQLEALKSVCPDSHTEAKADEVIANGT